MSTTTNNAKELARLEARQQELAKTVAESQEATQEMARIKQQKYGILYQNALANVQKAQEIYAIVQQAMKNGGIIKMNLFVHEANEEKGTSVEINLSNTELSNDHNLITMRAHAVERFCETAANLAGAKMRQLQHDPEYTNEAYQYANGGFAQ